MIESAKRGDLTAFKDAASKATTNLSCLEMEDKYGDPMYYAVVGGHEDIVKFIGNDIEWNEWVSEYTYHDDDLTEFTLADIAAINGHTRIVELLEGYGSFVRYNGLSGAVMNGHIEVLKYVDREQGYDAHDNEIMLEFAIECGHLDIVKYILSKEDNNSYSVKLCIETAKKEGRPEIDNYLKTLL